jgi:hypothetical protein
MVNRLSARLCSMRRSETGKPGAAIAYDVPTNARGWKANREMTSKLTTAYLLVSEAKVLLPHTRLPAKTVCPR